MAAPRVLLPVVVFTAILALGASSRDGQQGEARSRYLLLRGEHTLLPEEREALEQIGCRVIRGLGQREYIVRVSPSARARLAEQPFVAEVDVIPESWRVHPSARRELARIGPLARLNVIFHDDVTFDEAVDVVARAGGWLSSPLELDFKLPRRLEIVLPDDRLEQLSAKDVVLQIHGPMPPIIPMNAQAAALSSVPQVHAAPYELSGAGVVLSVFDLGESGPGLVDITHNEFEGRVEKVGNFGIAEHATHVTGTITAKGLNAQAKGMAPAARVHNFAAQDSFLDDKATNFTRLGIRADNNSWGFVHGWSNAGRGWEWYGDDRGENDQLFGAYGIATSAVDRLVRDHQTLIIFAAGNDNSDGGPTVPPFEHFHEERSTKYCYSTDGSGTDCPTICAQCETVRHKRDGPFQTMNLVASGKNTVAVGAVSSSKGVTSFSARGPARDGRIKPDVVAKGLSMLSTAPNQSYLTLSGTSMAAPVVTGITALLIEQWRKTFAGATPSPETLRVLLVQGAEDLTTPPGDVSAPLVGPDYVYGFGLVSAKDSVDTIIADGGTGSRIKSGTVSQGATVEYPMSMTAGATAKITLGWSDPEAIPYPERALINNLDLRVVQPDGTSLLPFVLNPADPAAIATRGVNNVDTLEQVVIENAMAGTHRIQVVGTAISTTSPQSFVVASSAAIGPQISPCVDVYEPNDTLESAFGRLLSGTALTGRTCTPTDVDFYRFVVDRSGTVRVSVTPSDTPLRVTLFADGALSNTINAQPGSTSSIQIQLGTGTNQPVTPVNYTVQIVPTGQIGPIASYVLTVSFNRVPPGRQRVVRH